jgi:catalase
MPFEEAKSYRFNPFDLTKVWPHSDYPLIDVGRLTLDRNVSDYHTEMEQAAFQPNNAVPGTGLSPDKMLLARGFAYADAHRARIGVNYQQIPVNRAKVVVRAYSKDGAMRVDNAADPVYYPNSIEAAPAADEAAYAERAVWSADGDMVRAAYTLHAEDDDYGQANTMINQVLDDAARDRLVDNVAGHAAAVNREDILQRVFEYWRNIDKAIGDRVETACLEKRKAGDEVKLLD